MVRAFIVFAAVLTVGMRYVGENSSMAAEIAIPPMSLPGPKVESPKTGRLLRPPLAGIDCTFGVACPIIWSPPKTAKTIEPPQK